MNKLKIAIIGYGIVGKATHRTIQKHHTVLIHDPEQGYKSSYKIADIIFICTPTHIVKNYVDQLSDHKYTYIRSTIPFNIVRGTNFAVWPEFLTERHAEYDSVNPKTNVVGGNNDQFNALASATIFKDFHYTTNVYAALMKISTNIYFIQKVTYANMLYNLCKAEGLDYEQLKSVIGADERMWINDHWEVPGPDGKKGWGGKCFPKNLELIKEMGFNNEFCKLMESFNEDQRE